VTLRYVRSVRLQSLSSTQATAREHSRLATPVSSAYRLLAPKDAIHVPGRASALLDPVGVIGAAPRKALERRTLASSPGGAAKAAGASGWELQASSERGLPRGRRFSRDRLRSPTLVRRRQQQQQERSVGFISSGRTALFRALHNEVPIRLKHAPSPSSAPLLQDDVKYRIGLIRHRDRSPPVFLTHRHYVSSLCSWFKVYLFMFPNVCTTTKRMLD
jgi:hypothetical protein